MRYFIGFLVSLGLIILVLIMILRGGGDNAKTPQTAKTLVSYATTDADVSLLMDGPVNSDKIHQQVRITVDADQVTYQHLTGFDGTVADQQVYPNTQAAYAPFLRALALAGFTEGDKDPAHADYRGYCPLGQRYVFELNEGSNNLQRFWSTNCTKGVPHTYLGDSPLTLTLFQKQVPDYDTLTANIAW
ncbi:MAG TPA: hypothetical protein VF401_01190 [Candidatus Saccharimonadales bacterium]